jgi:hypothetical protein
MKPRPKVPNPSSRHDEVSARSHDLEMKQPSEDVPGQEIEQQARQIRGLMAALYAHNDAVPDEYLLKELSKARKTLRVLEVRRDGARAAAEKGKAGLSKSMGVPLGPETTGLLVVTTIRLQPIPTGVYHLLDPETDPLLTVTIKNKSYDPRRVCVTAYIEGLSAKTIKTVELAPMDEVGQAINLLPSLIPEQARRITEVQRCTLNVEVVDLDNKVESQDTYSLVLLARNSSFNSVVDPVTARPRDMTKYYAAWVTPNVEPVQALVRKAAERVPGRCFWGYQARPKPDETATQVKASSQRHRAGATPTRSESTGAQVKALFDTLKEAGIVYVDSVIDFGAGRGQVTQRTRLPRESLRHRSANCIDGTVLFASLLEFASLHAAIVLVPGHAFVAWETWRGTNDWDYLETTMIGSADFETARQHARELFQQFDDKDLAGEDGPIPRVLKLNDLRAQGIWPME